MEADAAAADESEENTMMGYYGDTWFGMGTFGWFFMILFWGALIWFIIWLLRQEDTRHHHMEYRRQEKSAIEILDTRFAKGEIDKKEYADMKKEISR